MQLTELQTFLTILEQGSLVRASETLNVTQSTVTARLKSLESELDQVLINRQKSGATPTAAGVRLQRYASTIANLWGQARREIALPQGYSTMCNFGCNADLWDVIGEQLFNYIDSTVADSAVAISIGNDKELSEWLNAGLIDIALTYRSQANPTQQSFPLHEDRLVLVSTDSNSPVRFDPDYIFVEAGEDFGREHTATYADADTARISFNNAKVALDYMVRQGGSAYLPQRIVIDPIKNKQLFELDSAPVFSRQSYLICNTNVISNWPWFDDCLDNLTSQTLATVTE